MSLLQEYFINDEKKLIDLAYSLGTPIPSRRNGKMYDHLIPLKEEDAHPQSLSGKFGIGDFPFHSDGAYYSIPPKYIILRYIQGIEYPTPTILCNLTNIALDDQKSLQYSIWKVRALTPFYSSILSPDRNFIRFDSCVMRPINEKNDNTNILSKIISKSPIETINWESNKTIVVDNWKYLHKRPKVKTTEVNFRTLQRIMVL